MTDARSSADARLGAAESESDWLRRPQATSDISFRKLQVFWAVAHAGTLTKAAKLLGVTQPTLSQQLSSLESAVGGLLFERRSNALILTDLGGSILSKAEQVLRSLQELQDGLPTSGTTRQRAVRVAGTTSAMRRLLPEALQRLRAEARSITFDLHEDSPAEVLDLLYARKVNIGLVAETAIAQVGAGFRSVLIFEDPYVLVVPRQLELEDVFSPLTDLSDAERAMINNTLQFSFGTLHTQRVQSWYDRVLPQNRLAARVRSFELMVGLVCRGIGVCIAPALSVPREPEVMKQVRLYETGLPPRRTVAMYPAHYSRQEPYSRLLALLQEVSPDVHLPPITPTPPFIRIAEEGSS
jgi:DNA-binding transcriptional LysR family regulator